MSVLLVAHLEFMFCFTSFNALWGVTSLDDSLSSGIWFWSSAMSIVAEHAADAGMLRLLLSTMLCLLSGDRSVTRSML